MNTILQRRHVKRRVLADNYIIKYVDNLESVYFVAYFFGYLGTYLLPGVGVGGTYVVRPWFDP